MIQFNVGNLWTKDFIKFIDNKNREEEEHKPQRKITELYGSFGNILPSARPAYRTPRFEKETAIEMIDMAHSFGIGINYTLNQWCIGDISEFEKDIDKFKAGVASIAEVLNVDKITVAHPLVAEVVYDLYGDDIPLVISTITSPASLGQLSIWKEMYPSITKFCMPIWRNRNTNWLMRATELGKHDGFEIEVLVNEFCSIQGQSCHGIFRDNCYMLHSHGGNLGGYFEGFPISWCKRKRYLMWHYLAAPFIPPSVIANYHHKGITNFKITGRTHGFDEVKPIIERYISLARVGSDANVLDLWLLDQPAKFNVPENYMPRFFENWLSPTVTWKCEDEDCSSCLHCHKMSGRILGVEPQPAWRDFDFQGEYLTQ